MLVRIFQKNRPIEQIHTQVYFKELAHEIVGLPNPKSEGRVGRTEIQVKVDVTGTPE